MDSAIDIGTGPAELCAALKRLEAAAELRPEDEAFALQALASKWTGVQVDAVKVLVTHLGPRAVPRLRSWLDQRRANKGLRRVAYRALARCINRDDLRWVVAEYFADREGAALFLIAACFRYPDPQIAERLAADVRRGETWSAIVLNAVAFPNRDSLFRALLADPALPERDFIQRIESWGTVSREHTLLADRHDLRGPRSDQGSASAWSGRGKRP